MRQTILIYCPFTSNRLLYILDWVFKTRLGISYTLTDNPDEISIISYGANSNGINIPSSGLLKETGIQQHEIKTTSWLGLPAFYAAEGYMLPFDIFSAIFYLLSRYEEYFSFTPDKHGRYPAEDSIAFKNGWLERPLIDEWIMQLGALLEEKGIHVSTNKFSFTPTYDIDIAWSYKNKGITRNIGGLFKDILTLRLNAVVKRISVLAGNTNDPFDAFDNMRDWHKRYNLTPVYFVLSALRNSAFDKNVSPLQTDMQKLILAFAEESIVGIHPSYNTNTIHGLLNEEKDVLEKISGQNISYSRQHYIRLWFPLTYRHLLASGITKDYSMGYGTHLGFRAGTGAAFNWYDLENEIETSLLVYPFCFMDSTAHYELKLTATEAFERLEKMGDALQKANSSLITVFHNFSLGTDNEWAGWVESYTRFLKRMGN